MSAKPTPLNPKQEAEVAFWRHLVATEDAETYLRRRRSDFYNNIVHYAGWCDLAGRGLEVGTGCFSQLEWAQAGKIISIDPLNEVYSTFLHVENSHVLTQEGDGEHLTFPNSSLDWVVCWNVIDHTPEPQKLADEIFRVLKPGGHLYFEVHFDDQIAAPHYALWREDTVEAHFTGRTRLFANTVRNDAGHQSLHYAVYRKEGRG